MNTTAVCTKAFVWLWFDSTVAVSIIFTILCSCWYCVGDCGYCSYGIAILTACTWRAELHNLRNAACYLGAKYMVVQVYLHVFIYINGLPVRSLLFYNIVYIIFFVMFRDRHILLLSTHRNYNSYYNWFVLLNYNTNFFRQSKYMS